MRRRTSVWCRWIGAAARFAMQQGVRVKFGVAPALIPDYLALVGDAADGYPGDPEFGAKTAARVIERYGAIEQFPAEVLGHHLEHALLFKDLATLRTRRAALRRRRRTALEWSDGVVRDSD